MDPQPLSPIATMTTTTTTTVRFSRTSCQDGATETLTVIRLPEPVYCEYLERECEFGVQVTAGEGEGEEVVGIYDLDGGQPRFAFAEVEAVDESKVPADVVQAVDDGWDRGGTCTVKRLAA